jgi:hypothetical protein
MCAGRKPTRRGTCTETDQRVHVFFEPLGLREGGVVTQPPLTNSYLSRRGGDFVVVGPSFMLDVRREPTPF